MICNLRALGLALVAMIALSALTTSTATATPDKLTSASVVDQMTSGAVLTGSSENNVFKITAVEPVEVKCATAKVSGTVSETSREEVTVFPTYFGTPTKEGETEKEKEEKHQAPHCASSLGEATVDMNGCDYDVTGFTGGTDEGKNDAIVSITCPVGHEIKITSALCTIKIPEQTPTSGGVTYTKETENGKNVVKITATSTGITYESEGSLCGGISKEGDNADYNGTVVVTGYEDTCKAGECPINGDEFKEGSQIDIAISEGAGNTVLTGSGKDNVFKITATESVKVECTTAKFAGTAANPATVVTVFPTYSGTIGVSPHTAHCSSSLGAVTVDVNGCSYDLTGETTGSDNGGTDATVSITCPTGHEIELTSSLCKIKIPAQTPTSGGVTYTKETENGKNVVKITATSTGITYTTEGTFCALGGLPSEGNNGDYTGTVVATGYEDICKACSINGDEIKDGEQVAIEVS